MTRLQTILVACVALFAQPAFIQPAFAHDGVHIEGAYAVSKGAVGATGAIFFVVQNHQAADDVLLAAASDAAELVQLHTHIMADGGVMQMRHMPEGFIIPANGEHALLRGGDHVMMMGLTRALADGDMITLTLTFEKAGEVILEVPVDNQRKDAPMDHGAHKMPAP
jgi:copper(I)-binding protein